MSLNPILKAKSVFLLAMICSPDTYANSLPMETVTVTASRDQQALGDQAASLTVISEQELDLNGQVHINELMARVPGVWVSRGNGQEHLTAIRSPVLTGAGSCGSFYIAEDGVAVRPTGFCNVNQLFDINTAQAGQIEIIRGPGTVVHGSDAQHGVINVLSKAPAHDTESKLSLEAGSNDYARIKFTHSDASGQHSYRINFNGASDGGYKHDSGFDQQKLTGRHDYQIDDLKLQTLLSLSNLNQETAGYVQGLDAYKDSRLKRDNPNPEAFRDSHSARIQTRLVKQFDKGGVFIATPYARYSAMTFQMHFLPGTPLEENGQSSTGLQTAYRRPVSQSLTLTQGADLEYTRGWLKQSQQGGFSSFPAGKHYDYKVTAKLIAAFLEADYQVSPTTKLTAGLRYEKLEYDYDNLMISGDTAEDGSICVNGFTGAIGCRYSRPDDSVDDFDNASFSVSLLRNLNRQLSAVIRLAHGFRAPQATEMYRLQNGQQQANLDAEEVNNIEFGLRGDSNRLYYNVNAFYMKKNNVIFQSSDRLNLDDGQTRHFGLEYDLSWLINPQWQLHVAGTLARHQYLEDVTTPGPGTPIATTDNDIDTAPRHMSSVRLGWLPAEPTRIELEWLSMGKYYTDINNLHTYSGHKLLNLRLRQKLNKNVSIGLRINNLSDQDYAERADFSSFNGDRYFIGEPRSYYGDITITF